jgi:osmotically inducible protein OsmC
MAIRKAEAIWKGTLKDGSGTMQFGSGAFAGAYSFQSRFEEGAGTNPEELVGAAHAGCFSMALSADLGRAGYSPESVHTTASVHLEKLEAGWTIVRIDLDTVAAVDGLDEEEFRTIAQGAKENCPVSRALSAVEITLEARLAS